MKGKKLSMEEVLQLEDGTKVVLDTDDKSNILGVKTGSDLITEEGSYYNVNKTTWEIFNRQAYDYEEEIILKHKVGDQVRIKEDLIQGYVDGTDYDIFINGEMISLGGKVAKITRLLTTKYDYALDIDEGRYSWSEEMIEDYEEVVTMKELKGWEVLKMIDRKELKEGDKLLGDNGMTYLVKDHMAGNLALGYMNEEGYPVSPALQIRTFTVLKFEPIPVPFMEAAQAKQDGKDIYCIIGSSRYDFKVNGAGVLIDEDGSVNMKQILEGKWYIK